MGVGLLATTEGCRAPKAQVAAGMMMMMTTTKEVVCQGEEEDETRRRRMMKLYARAMNGQWRDPTENHDFVCV